MTTDLPPELKKRASSPTLSTVPRKKQISWRQRALDNEVEITGGLCFLVVAGYYMKDPIATKCLTISYQMSQDQYGKGYDDYYFVVFWTIAFTFLRAAIMKFFFHPIAKMAGIQSFGKRQRFAEQGWMFSYYSVFWAFGMYIMYNSPHWFNTSQYWIDYPHTLISRKMKVYYLMQLAFWFHQVYLIHIEKRRKDHFAMLTHHIITIILLVSSYYSNFTRIGNAVLCCMDVADIFLSLAKVLKYLGMTTLCDICFGLFAVSWPVTRHIFFSIIIWATAVEPSTYLDMKWEPEKGKYFTPFTQKLYLLLFVLLNSLMFYWFAMIIKVILRVLQGKNAEDSRSDDEDDNDEEVEVKEDQTSDDKPANGKHS